MQKTVEIPYDDMTTGLLIFVSCDITLSYND